MSRTKPNHTFDARELHHQPVPRLSLALLRTRWPASRFKAVGADLRRR